jgi:hypothetical protein
MQFLHKLKGETTGDALTIIPFLLIASITKIDQADRIDHKITLTLFGFIQLSLCIATKKRDLTVPPKLKKGSEICYYTGSTTLRLATTDVPKPTRWIVPVEQHPGHGIKQLVWENGSWNKDEISP